MSLTIFQLLDLKKGFSLPLWVAGAAKSAFKILLGSSFQNYELIKIPNENRQVKIEVDSAAFIQGNSHAMGITYAKSDLALDLTQNLEIWTIASLEKSVIKNITQKNQINIIAGYGVGIDQKTSEICISLFAKEVLYENLLDIIPDGFKLNLEIIFPNGKFLAERTTSADTFSSASPDQLKNAKGQLEHVIENNFKGKLIFVIGENGLDLAKSCNIKFPIIKVGNWIGPLLVDAAIKNVKTVILFGYHGKLI